MQQSLLTANPFAMMLNPEAVLDAMNRSDRLSSLKSHICRPLDKPLIRPEIVQAFMDSPVAEADKPSDSDPITND